eukprot:6208361-Pleurochrysis_carterae.AAC.2
MKLRTRPSAQRTEIVSSYVGNVDTECVVGAWKEKAWRWDGRERARAETARSDGFVGNKSE